MSVRSLLQDTKMQLQELNKGIEHYHRDRVDGDIDLIKEVRDTLVESGLGLNLAQAYDANRFILEGKDKSSDVQRFLLNRYWSQQLMSANKVSIEEKYCLIPNGEISAWLTLFRQKIVPFAIANNLPIVI